MRGSLVSMQVMQELALILQNAGESPLKTLQIYGEENSMTDIPSHSFGSNPSWSCKNDIDLLNFSTKISLCHISTLGPYSAVPDK